MSALLLASALLLPGAAPVPASDPTVYPEIAGTTIIHGTGITGVVMWAPEEVELIPQSMKLEVSEGTSFARVVVNTGTNTEEGLCDFCTENSVRVLPQTTGFKQESYSSLYDESIYPLGPVEFYFISDGEVTFSVNFSGLEGRVEVTATGTVDGALKRLPSRCNPLPDCKNFGYGFEVGEVGVGRPGQAYVVAYSEIPFLIPDTPAPNPGSVSVVPCAYPGFWAPNGSSDPADHPYGCDTVVTNPEGPDSIKNTGDFVGRAATGNPGYVASTGWARIHGKIYLGYMAEWQSAFEGHYGAFAHWLNQGIGCPSRDFFDCDKEGTS